MKLAFSGGIHPAGHKELTNNAVPVEAKAPEIVAIPLKQHIGAPCTALVEKGAHVYMGQKIGDGEGMTVPVHASVSGEVIAVEPRKFPGWGDVECIVIKNDFKDEFKSDLKAHDSADSLNGDEILRIIREAGIVGMGGAAFPTNIKAKVPLGDIDTVIANACECEPYITSDDMLLRTNPEKVLGGLKLIAEILRPKRIVIAVEDNKKEAIDVLRGELKNYPMIELSVLPTRYPQGAEKQLIYAVTKREVPSGKLPKDIGCGVFNTATCASVYEAVIEGMPVIRRIVTITGEGANEPKNMIVRFGTSYEDALNAAGGIKPETEKVLSGGPMMGLAQPDLKSSVVKGNNAILCLLPQKKYDETACIRCGKCTEVCPIRLQPLYLYRNVKNGNTEGLKKLGIMDCIECGCCAYGCPAKLPLTESFRLGKKAVREAMAK
ncbi:MAG: electron transport complex subunit RsxC [Eubacteriales bacterium]|nr:electron transport complex subunit RsxC [Eubacteriales bacterium]